jgi:hypothetical protein
MTRNFVLPALLLVFVVRPASAQPASRWCRNEGNESRMLSHLREALAGEEEHAATSRRIFRLPDVAPDSVRLVLDERVCERAARVYYRHRLGPMPGGGVEVARVADHYYVYGSNSAGEWTTLSVYTLQFENIANVAD